MAYRIKFNRTQLVFLSEREYSLDGVALHQPREFSLATSAISTTLEPQLPPKFLSRRKVPTTTPVGQHHSRLPNMTLFILTETSAGYALLKAKDKKLLKRDDLATDIETAEGACSL